MPPRERPQLRFLLRASALLAAMLALWWFALRGPLLDWVQLSADFVLHSIPGVQTPTGVTVEGGGIWTLQVPVPADSDTLRRVGSGMWFRSIRIQVLERVPTQFTVSLPLYWAVLFAAPWSWRLGRSLALGTAILLVIPPFSLLAYAAHVVKLNLYPHAAPFLGWLLDVADYVGSNVLPYILPVLLAIALHRDLRRMVLAGEMPEAAEAPLKKPRRRARRS